jgi:hypothetical protein
LNASIWAVPGEVSGVRFAVNRTTLNWTAPSDIGGIPGSVRYDTIRSTLRNDFNAPGVCVESNDGSDLAAIDATIPSAGSVLYYLIRAENDCGTGTIGNGTNGPRPPARACN